MDVICYYKNQKRVSVFELPQDSKARSLGSHPNNDYTIVDSELIAPIHAKIKFESGIYQIMAIDKLSMEEFSLPLNDWIDLPLQKKLCLKSESSNEYLIFCPNVSVKKNPERKKTSELKIVEPKLPEKALKSEEAPNPTIRRPLVKKDKKQTLPYGFHEIDREDTTHKTPASPISSDTSQNETITAKNVVTTPKLKLAPDPVLDQEDTLCGKEMFSKATNKSSDEHIGKWIDGRYRVIQVLGKGGMGIVYKVLDEKLKRFVALKLLLSTEQSALEAIQRFLTEARSMAKLQHKNIVRVYNNGIHEGLPYFTMDLIDGKELQKCLTNLKPRKAMNWILSLCEAVHYFHQSGIIHRDLKPSNIMISQTDEPLLMDFGIARDQTTLSGLTTAGQSIGTPAYMAPEQAKGLVNQVDIRTDVYGLGSILYEMLAGRPPFSGPPMQVLYKVCNEEPVSIESITPTIPKDIIIIVQKAMSKEKAFRYSSAQEMAEDVRRYLDGLRIHAQLPPLPLRIIRKLKQNKYSAYITLGCTLMIVIALSLILHGRYKDRTNRYNQIQASLKEASETLKMAEQEQENAITFYIQASENYTKVLGLDKKNEHGRKGKFKVFCLMAEYAIRDLHDYQFAKTMYVSAHQMGIDNSTVAKKIHDLEEIETQENKVLQDKLQGIFEYLQR